MKIILSPAKTLDFKTPLPDLKIKFSKILFQDQASQIAETLKSKSKPQLKKIFNVSDAIAILNHKRYQDMLLGSENNSENRGPNDQSRPAIFSFNGPAYKSMNVFNENANEKFMKNAQEKLMILCGLYGIVRPLDKIEEYRLEMGNKFEIDGNKKISNLYDFWENTLTEWISKNYKKSKKQKYLANLASQEYSKSIDFDFLIEKNIKIAHFNFYTDNKQAAVYSKQARGLMSRYIIENDIEDFEGLEKFDLEGYKFAHKEELDDDGNEVEFNFKRKKPEKKVVKSAVKQGTKRKR